MVGRKTRMTVEEPVDRLSLSRIALYAVCFVLIAGSGILLEYFSHGVEMAVNLGVSYIIVLLAVIVTILCILYDRKIVEMFRPSFRKARAA